MALFENRLVGDVNDDGVFDSADLVIAFQAGNYSANAKSNAFFVQFDPFAPGMFEQDKPAKRPAHLP